MSASGALGGGSSHGYLYDLLACMEYEGYLKVVYI